MTEPPQLERNIGCSATPLLFLLDGVLSHDPGRTKEALDEIQCLLLSKRTTSTTNNNNQKKQQLLLLPDDICPLQEDGLLNILETLLESFPGLCSVNSGHDGSLPLHFAASLGWVSCARVIHSKFPKAASCPNQKGKIPLHYAAREGRLEMVQFLLGVNPQTASIATAKQKLALHFAAGEGHAQIVHELLRVHPQSAQLASAKGKLPLHFCARWGFVNVAKELLHVYPQAISKLDWEGSLPLHDAAREGQVAMARFLIARYPQALQTANLRNEVPLFAAVRTNHLDLVLLMIQSWPLAGKQILQATQEDDTIESWQPQILELLLRGAVNNFSGCELIQPVAAATATPLPDTTAAAAPEQPSPSANKRTHKKFKSSRCKSPVLGDEKNNASRKRPRLETRHVRTFLPLHAALQAQASRHVVQYVLQQNPDSVHLLDDDSRYPLHLAVCHAGVTDLLLDESLGILSNQQVVRHRDRLGNLPLHLGLAHNCHVTVIKKLLALYPESGVERCQVGGNFYRKRPLDMALYYNCNLSTIFELLKVDPSYVSR